MCSQGASACKPLLCYDVKRNRAVMSSLSYIESLASRLWLQLRLHLPSRGSNQLASYSFACAAWLLLDERHPVAP